MKIISTIIIAVLLSVASYAQKPNEAEARQFLEKVWGYLKISDSASFVNLWSPEDSAWQKLHTPPGTNYMESFYRLKKFLSPAISANLDLDHVVVGEETARGTQITAMLKPKENAYLGFTFYVASVNGKWIPRGKPNYLAKSR